MIGPGRDIRKQKRGDKSIKTSGYNNMQDLLKALSRGQPDMTSMQLMRVWGSGRAFVGRPPTKPWPQLWDLIGVTTNSYKIQGSPETSGMADLAGIFVGCAEGDFTWDSTNYYWESGTITDNTFQYCYLLHDIAAQTVTLKKSATRPNIPDDEHHTKLLWYIPWDAGISAINTDKIYGHRDHYNWFSSP